jgi:16S rRNA G966 N2-methylase RsmD
MPVKATYADPPFQANTSRKKIELSWGES